MKSIVFLALVAAAVAHWPYADQEDKFRVSGLSLLGSSLALDPTFHWIFSPLNNQLLPTFQMRFPHAPLATSNSKSGLVYTIVLDHLAEVRPNGGTFTLVPGTTINLNEVAWFTNTFTRYYDDESMGEVIEFTVQAYDLANFETLTSTGLASGLSTQKLGSLPANTGDALFPVAIRIRLFPDSADDLVDITVFIQNYSFVDYEVVSATLNLPTSHLALFWKIAASTGEEPYRNVPLSLDYDAMTFEVDSDVKFRKGTVPTKRFNARSTNSTRSKREHEPIVANAKTMKALATAARAAPQLFGLTDLAGLDHTTSQLWISGGYVATVFGVVPDDLLTNIDIQATATIAVRTFRAVPDK